MFLLSAIPAAMSSVVMQPLVTAGQAALFSDVGPFTVIESQRAFGRAPVNIPSPEALMTAFLKGHFGNSGDAVRDRKLALLYGKMLALNGITLPGGREASDRWKDVADYQTAWDVIHDSQIVKPGIQEAFRAWIAGFINQAEFNLMLQRQGALSGDWQWMFPLMCNRLSPAELVPLYNRGILNDKQFETYMQQLQFGLPSDVALAKELTKEMPGYTDIVRFAVRDAFNPQQVEALGLAKELNENPEYLDWAKASGLGDITIVDRNGKKITKNMAEMYWYAHWELPSPGQTYQFVHRYYPDSIHGPSPELKHASAFTEKDAANLLKANDYSPQFRRHLLGLSYLPYTRIDVRRVREMGIITEGEVYHNYRISGYDDEHARKLTKYVEQSTQDKVKLPMQKMLKGKMCKAFQVGIVTGDEFNKRLKDAGIEAKDIVVQRQSCEMELQLSVAKEGISMVKNGFLSGALDVAESKQLLSQFGVVPQRIENYIFLWQTRLTTRRRVVAAREVSSWFVSGLIDITEFISRLSKLDYDPPDITRIVQAAQLEQSKNLKRQQKRAADEMQRQIQRNLLVAERQRKESQIIAREQKREHDKALDRVNRLNQERMRNFLSARSEANLREWLANGEITESEVKETLLMKGFTPDDANRWINAARKRRST